jgi:hypothetical protein
MAELKTCFKKVEYDLSGLLFSIDIGDIGLPDLQRPFVWSNTRVRDLFDSMYRGFPVGNMLFWENGIIENSRQIGVDGKQRSGPARLIVDGQQRLTSLYAVIKGKKVRDKNYNERNIEIAFRPRDGKFEVSDAAIKKDAEWIPNITEIWTLDKGNYEGITEFIEKLSQKKTIDPTEKKTISANISKLYGLNNYPFTAFEINQTVGEEEVANIFVRINSTAVPLNQADFILTLLSVFWDEGRKDLEKFCATSRKTPKAGDPPSPFNYLIQPDADQLLRVSIALGFKRGKLQSVYQLLRGKDLDTGEFSAERRVAQFAILQGAQKEVLNLMYWDQFLKTLIGAGFRTSELISSQTAVLYAYAFYLIGRLEHKIPEHVMQRLISRWFYASSLTGRYSSSAETVMEQDLNRIKDKKDADSFMQAVNEMMMNQLTNDFWMITLPHNLDNSSARSPELFTYMAAQNKLAAPVLFSINAKKVSDLLDPSLKTMKKALDRHHLFPKAWLIRQNITDLKQINQIANFALLEWPDNIEISDTPPKEYLPNIQKRFTPEIWTQMTELHALPNGWEHMEYDIFLTERRKLMAGIIRKGFETL